MSLSWYATWLILSVSILYMSFASDKGPVKPVKYDIHQNLKKANITTFGGLRHGPPQSAWVR